MDKQLLTNLIALYLGMVVINLLISFQLWRTYKSHLYRLNGYVWVSLFVILLYQGLADGNDLAMALGSMFGLACGYVLALVMGAPMGAKPDSKIFLVSSALGGTLLLTTYFSFPGAPFYAYCLPGLLGSLGPTIFFSVRLAVKNWKSITVAHRGLLIAGIIQFVHQLDFPFLRDAAWFAPYGFTIAILSVFSISIFLPLTIGEVIAMESQQLKLSNQALQASLAVTGAVQALLFPKQNEQRSGPIQHAAYHKPALQCGGDWWWALERANGRKLYLMGDVTGHGPGPAMITALLSSSFQTLARLDPHFPLEKLFSTLHQSLRDAAQGQYLITFAALEVDQNHVLHWVNAAAPPVLVRNARGEVEAIVAPSAPLGGDTLNLASGSRELRPGDRVLFFTDGIYEFNSTVGQPFGLRKLSNLFASVESPTVSASRDAIVDRIHASAGGTVLEDDLTFLVIDCAAEGSPA